VGVDALEYVDEVGVRVDPVKPARDQQALETPDVLGADLRPARHPILASRRDHSKYALEMIGIQWDIRVLQGDTQLGIPDQRVLRRLGERVRGEQDPIPQRLLQPLNEPIHNRLAQLRTSTNLFRAVSRSFLE
jgi:hypothetical protein